MIEKLVLNKIDFYSNKKVIKVKNNFPGDEPEDFQDGLISKMG